MELRCEIALALSGGGLEDFEPALVFGLLFLWGDVDDGARCGDGCDGGDAKLGGFFEDEAPPLAFGDGLV